MPAIYIFNSYMLIFIVWEHRKLPDESVSHLFWAKNRGRRLYKWNINKEKYSASESQAFTSKNCFSSNQTLVRLSLSHRFGMSTLLSDVTWYSAKSHLKIYLLWNTKILVLMFLTAECFSFNWGFSTPTNRSCSYWRRNFPCCCWIRWTISHLRACISESPNAIRFPIFTFFSRNARTTACKFSWSESLYFL